MRKSKFNFLTSGLSILFLIAGFITTIHTASAQKETTENKLLKYELSIDLVPVIDEGRFGKVYFKINHYKEDQLKGAYRLGVSKGIYFLYNEDESTFPEGVTVLPDKHSHLETGLF